MAASESVEFHGPAVRFKLQYAKLMLADEIVDGLRPYLSNSAESVEKLHRVTLLAGPVPGAVAPGVVLVFPKDFTRLRSIG